MTTLSHVQEAHHQAPKDRFALRGFLRVSDTASAEDKALAGTMLSAFSPAGYDQLLADTAIARLFTRGVIYIGEKK